MKFLKVLLTTLSLTVNANLPPTTIQGQNGTKSGFFNLQVPNNSITKLNSTTALLETGNDNLLENGSFEHPQATAIWSITGTPTLDTSNQVHGKQALSVSISATTVAVNTSTINAANISGLQGAVRAYVKTSLTDVSVCSYIDSAEQSCVQVVSNNSWRSVEIPAILGGTSNGIKIKTDSSTSGTVLIDGAFVGVSSPFQNVSGAKLLGTLKYAGTANCIWSYSSATWGNYSADTDCATPSTTGALSAPGTKIPAFVLPAGSPAGTYQIVLNTMMYKGTSNGFGMFRFSDGTNSSNGSGIYLTSQGSPNIVGEIVYSSSLSAATTVQLQSKVSAGILEVYGTDTTDGLSFSVYYYPPESRIYSQASQDYDWTQFSATSPNSSFTISSSECFKKRKGSDLLLRCKVTPSAGAAIEGRIALPDSLVSANSSIIPSIQIAGQMEVNSIGAVGQTIGSSYGVYIEPSVGYVTFGGRSSGTTGLVKQTATNIATTTTFSFYATIPIQGWQDYGVIVGSFKDYVSTPGSGKPVMYSFKRAAAGTVSNEIGDIVNGNCTNASPSVCTLNSVFASTPNCTCTGDSGASVFCLFNSISSSSLSVRLIDDAGGVQTTAQSNTVVCHGIAP